MTYGLNNLLTFIYNTLYSKVLHLLISLKQQNHSPRPYLLVSITDTSSGRLLDLFTINLFTITKIYVGNLELTGARIQDFLPLIFVH